jgi:hypothetical protein
MSYGSMRAELELLTKEALDPAGWVATPMQRKRFKVIGRQISKDPSKGIATAGRHLVRAAKHGLKSGLKTGPLWARGLSALAVADPAITAYNVRKHPEEYRGKKGRTMGRALGSTVGFLAGSKLPFVGQVAAGLAGEAVGSRIGRLAD